MLQAIVFMPYSLVPRCHHFEGVCCSHLQGWI